MKAAVLHNFGEPLKVEDLPVPIPAADEVLINVAACGVCHSDLHIAIGDWDLLKPATRLPLVPGHEVTGTIVEVGEEVSEFKPGDRVGVPWLHSACGVCEYCTSGRETLCGKQVITGVMVDGGYAEFVKAKASHIAHLPDNLGFVEAAPLLCAGVTVYRAIKDSGIQSGQRLVVFGVGGLGHLAIQIGKEMGLETGAVDLGEDKLQLALDCGADWTVNAATTVAHKEIKAHKGAHVALVTSASRAAYETALKSLRRGGTLVIVGMTPEPIPLSVPAMLAGEYRIIASTVGTRQDLREMLDIAARGRVKCRVREVALESVNQVYAEMQSGSLVGRSVIKL